MYKAGTVAELESFEIEGKLPEGVYQEILNIVTMLDELYGEDRDINFDDGGYVFIAENEADLTYFDQNCVELESPTLEYIELVQSDKGAYLNAFFLANEYESGITLFVPLSIAPERLLKEIQISELSG